MKYAKKISAVLCACLLLLGFAIPVLAQTRSTSFVYHRFTDVPAIGGGTSVITESTRSTKVTNGGVGTFKAQTASLLRPYAQLVNSNNDPRSDYTQLSSNNTIYYTTLRNAVINYYYYPRVKSHTFELNKTTVELWYSSDEVK